MPTEEQGNPDAATESAPEVETRVFQNLIARLLAGDTGAVPPLAIDDATIAAIVERALQHDDCLAQLLQGVLPDESVPPVVFYERLGRLQRLLGQSDVTARIVGRVWSAALSGSDQQRSELLLAAFVNLDGIKFWLLSQSLPVILEQHELRPAIAVDFLSRTVGRVEGDGGCGIIWEAVRAFCQGYPGIALQVLSSLYESSSTARLDLATFILGTLRKLPLHHRDREESDRLSLCFRDHSTHQFRTVFNQSWVTTAGQAGITAAEMQELFARHDAGLTEEKHDIVSVIARTVLALPMAKDVAGLSLHWLLSNTNGALSSIPKFFIVNLVCDLLDTKKLDAIDPTFDPSQLLLAIQPIPVADMGTWQRISFYFERLFESNSDTFSAIFYQFSQNDSSGFHQVIRKPRSFEVFLTKVRGLVIADPVARLIVSQNAECRKLGLFLFEKMSIETLSPEVLTEADELSCRLAFHEMQRTLMQGESAGRFLVSLLPRIAAADAEFKKQFYDELLLRARDFATCRQELEKLGAGDSLVRQALDTVGRYFNALDRVRASGVREMEVPGYQRASRLALRHFAQGISAGVNEHSIIRQLCKNVNLLYGNRSGMYIGGQLRPSSPLTEVSHTMELPTVEFSDPEGMTLRRWHISAQIAGLSSHPSSDDSPRDP